MNLNHIKKKLGFRKTDLKPSICPICRNQPEPCGDTCIDEFGSDSEYTPQILNILNTKSSTKQEVFLLTKSVFSSLTKIIERKVNVISSDINKITPNNIEVGFEKKGEFETHINFSGDRLVFHMHSNVFDFHPDHPVFIQSYVKEDKMRSFCGVIHIYNFLNDSFKYNRLNDVGHLIARIFINKDGQFFVEGKIGVLFDVNTFGHDGPDQALKVDIPLTNNNWFTNLVDESILYALNFDLITPNFKDVNIVNLHQILDMNNNHKLRTSKSLGFKFSHENK